MCRGFVRYMATHNKFITQTEQLAGALSAYEELYKVAAEQLIAAGPESVRMLRNAVASLSPPELIAQRAAAVAAFESMRDRSQRVLDEILDSGIGTGDRTVQ